MTIDVGEDVIPAPVPKVGDVVKLEDGAKLDTPSVKLEVGAGDNPNPPLPPVLGTKDKDPELVLEADGLVVVPSSVTVLDPFVVGPNVGYDHV